MNKILLVEDDPEIIMLLHLHFSSPDHLLTVCSHGSEAIEIVLKEYFDLVISAMQLPDMEGIDMCRKMTARHVNRPVLMMIASEEDRAPDLAAGANDCIVKPFSNHELHEKTETLVNLADRLQMLQTGCDEEENANNMYINLQDIKVNLHDSNKN